MPALESPSESAVLLAAKKPAALAGHLFSCRQMCVIYLSFLAAGFFLLHHGFHSPMIYDSQAFIEANVQKFAGGNPMQVMSIVPERPVFMMTLYFNYLLTGMDPYYFRLFNLAVLAAAGVVLTLLSTLVFGAAGARGCGTQTDTRAVSVFLGLLFVIHPLQTLVVLYIWQREAILACFFYYGTVALYVATRSGRLRNEVLGYLFTGVCFLFGILTKENLLTVPVALLVAEVSLFRQTIGQTFRRALVIAGITLPPLLGHLLLSAFLHESQSLNSDGVVARLYGYYATAGLSPIEVALTASRVLFSHLLSIVVPFLNPVPFLKAEIISRSLWNPPTTVAAVVGIIALLAVGMGMRRRLPSAAFGLLFFVVAPAPELLLIPYFLFFGYRAILPMGGVLLVAGTGIVALIPWLRARLPQSTFRFGIGAAALVPVTCLALTTASLASKWNPLSVWGDSFRQLPPLSDAVEPVPYLQVLLNFGIQLVNAGDYTGAVDVLSEAAGLADEPESSKRQRPKVSDILRNHPGITTCLFYLGLAHLRAGHPADAVQCLRRALARDASHEPARTALAMALAAAGNAASGVEHLQKAVSANPQDLTARINLGLEYRRLGNLAAAAAQFRKSTELDPNSAAGYTNLAAVLEASGDTRAAVDAYKNAAKLMPDAPDVHFLLANALLRNGEVAESIEMFQRALQLKPDYADANANLGVALLSAGRLDEAIARLRAALQTLGGNAELHNALAAALAEKGEYDDAIRHLRKALAIEPNNQAARANLERLSRERAK